MQNLKRWLCCVLVLCMIVSAFPVTVFAEDADETADMDTGDVSIEGTNGFGNLISEEIAENQQATAEDEVAYPGTYSITDLVIEDDTAIVTYDSMEEATLVVAIYTEDGLQMLASGETLVNPDENLAYVTIEGDMPEYFLPSAYLLDVYDLSPLCAAYETPMYTQEMQELLASTVDDYAPEKVLNLDDDDTTNFAVYADSAIVINSNEGANTVASIDDENLVYVIQNADEQITSLAEGDVFAYPYGENEILIVKVADIAVDGTTVTITGSELEIEEAFSYVKLESGAVSEDMSVIEGTGDEGFTYVGLTEGANDDVTTYSLEGGAKAELYHEFGIDKTFSEDHVGGDNGGEEPNTIKLEGTLKIGLEFEFSYYVSRSRQYVKFTTKVGAELDIGISGELNKRACKLPSFGVSPIVGVYIGIEPQVEFQASAEVTWETSFSFTLGFSYSNDKGGQNLTTSPEFKSELKIEGTLFFGIDLNPTIEVLGGTLMDVDLTGLVGVEVKGKLAGTQFEHNDANVVHDCQRCIQGDVHLKVEVSVKIEFLKCKDLKVELDIFEAKHKLTDYYYSLTKGTVGLCTCPYTRYKIIFEVRSGIDLLVPNTEILKKDGTSLGTTNDLGVLLVWLPIGKTTVKAAVMGQELQKTVEVTEEEAGAKVVLKFGVTVSAKDYLTGAESAVDAGTEVASGECGDALTWTLYSNGLLKISGSGGMDSAWNAGWHDYKEMITSVVVGDGVTTIGDDAFSGCANLVRVSLPNSIISLGSYAFDGCTGLTGITIPESVRSIGDSTFRDCTNLVKADLPDGLVTIGRYAFKGCSGLESVIIPDSVTSLGEYALYECTSLSAVKLSGGLTMIEDYTFRYCSSLGSISIPEGIISIGESAFRNCTSLTEVDLPDSLSTISPYAFTHCTSLDNVRVPDGVTAIESYVFYNCNSMSAITLPDDITKIGQSAFQSCSSLSAIEFPDGLTALGQDAFKASGLTYVDLPDGIVSIPYGAFDSCGNLTQIDLPDSLTFIGNYALCGTDLTTLSFPDGMVTIDACAVAYCGSLTSVYIPDSVTRIGHNGFYECHAMEDVYYGGSEAAWNAISIEAFNDGLSRAQIHFNCAGGMLASPDVTTVWEYGNAADATLVNSENEAADVELQDVESGLTWDSDLTVTPRAIYPGEYGTESKEDYVLKSASFVGLVPGEQYVLLAMVSIDGENPLAADNLLFIDQAQALEDGTLVFRYVQRTPTDISYVVACGASSKDLRDAEISFPKMYADGALHVVAPTVVFDGKTLTEGMDYVIAGNVEYTEAGEYTCYIRGIHNYTGLVACSYTVGEAKAENPFDDVKSDDWFYDSVLWAVDNGITMGTGKTTFSPKDICTRGQVVTFLWRAAGEPEPVSGHNPFTDVKESDYFYKAVLWAVENEITVGTSDTTFSPKQTCTRAHVVTFLYRFDGENRVEGAENSFADVKVNDYYYDPVLWAVDNGITVGTSETAFSPKADCSRAQIVTFLYRFLD